MGSPTMTSPEIQAAIDAIVVSDETPSHVRGRVIDNWNLSDEHIQESDDDPLEAKAMLVCLRKLTLAQRGAAMYYAFIKMGDFKDEKTS